MNLRQAILILSLFGSHASIASEIESCPTIMLDQNDGTADHIPIWNQKKSPACYSFTASMLASVWIREEWSKARSDLSTFIDDPTSSYQSMSQSREFSRILDADLGRTCEATHYILNEKRKTFADGQNPAFTAPRCQMWGFTKNPINGRNDLRSPTEFSARMHELLQSPGRTKPFAIEYCQGAWKYPTWRMIKNRSFRETLTYLNDEKAALENFEKKCGFHAAIVTGQAVRNGKCNYRIRNTGGEAQKKNIDNGYYWIDANDLANNTIRVITLQND